MIKPSSTAEIQCTVTAVIMLWHTEGLRVWTAGSEAHISVEHSSMSCISACLCSSLQLEARWSPLTCILHLTSTLHDTTGVTPACRSVDVYFRGNYQINRINCLAFAATITCKYLIMPVFV